MEVFISYSHKDKRWRKKLEEHLSPLSRSGLLTFWNDRQISGGSEWAGTIDARLNRSGIILLLVSSTFMASDYCYEVEVARAIERHEAGEARVIPVILHPVRWEDSPLGRLQALPEDAKPITLWKNRDEAFLNVVEGIRAAVDELNSAGYQAGGGQVIEADEGRHYPRRGHYQYARHLTGDEKFSIAERLLECSSIKEPAERENVLKQLPFAADIPPHNVAVNYVLNILDVSLANQEGLESLLDAVAFSGAEPAQLRQVYDLLESSLIQPVSWAQVAELKAILSGVNIAGETLRRSYRACNMTGALLSEGRGEGGLLRSCINNLAQMACKSPATAPLLEFLESLVSDITDDSARAGLKNWMRAVARDLEVDLNLIRTKVAQRQAAKAAPPAGSPYVLVKVEPFLWDQGVFEVTGWLYYAGVWQSLPEKEGRYSRAELPSVLEEFFSEANNHLVDVAGGPTETGDEITVEVFLPLDLISCDVDRWGIKFGLRSEGPFGAFCKLVVRSLERAYHPLMRRTWGFWRATWKERPCPPDRVTDKHVFWAHQETDYDGAGLYAIYNELRNNKTLVFLGLSPVSALGEVQDQVRFLATVLDAGTPIALWPREYEGDAATLREEFRSVVYGNDLDAVPGVVHAMRRAAETDAARQPLWHHLTLLWDDPGRLPPDIQSDKFKAPRAGGLGL